MPSSRYKAVLFDVGGPLDLEIEHERLTDADIRAALQGLGVEVSDDAYGAACHYAVESFASNTYAAIIWRLAGGDADIARQAHAWLRARSPARAQERGGLELRPGIDRIIGRLSASGLKLGLAANQPARIIGDLDRLGIGRFFSHRQVSEHHGFFKPDVRLFLAACNDLGVTPEECIMVGDRIDNDIAPANVLGMTTILFRTGRHIHQQPRCVDEIPAHEVWDVDGLGRVLDQLTG